MGSNRLSNFLLTASLTFSLAVNLYTFNNSFKSLVNRKLVTPISVEAEKIKYRNHPLEERLSKLRCRDGTPVFLEDTTISRFISAGGTFDYANEMLDVDCFKGIDVGLAIKDSKEAGLNANDINELSKVERIIEREDTTKKEPMFGPISSLIEFGSIGGTAEYAKELAKILSVFGSTFHGSDLIRYKRAGGTVKEAKELAKITRTKDKKVLFFESGSMINLKESGGTVEQAIELAKFQTETGFPILYNGGGVVAFMKSGLDTNIIREISNVRLTHKGKKYPVLMGRALISYIKAGGTVEELNELAKIKNKQGIQMFRYGVDVCRFKEAGGTPEYANELLKIKKGSEPVFNTAEGLIACKDNLVTPEYAKILLSINFSPESKGFNNGGTIAYCKRDFNLAELAYLASLRNEEGNSIFSAKKIAKWAAWTKKGTLIDLVIQGGDPEFLSAMNREQIFNISHINKQLVSAFIFSCRHYNGIDETIERIRLHRMLGSTPQELLGQDTKKPNALIIQAKADHNNAFTHPTSVKMLDSLRKYYDVKIYIAKTETEVYKAIDANPNTDLLILEGHGQKTKLNLGRDSIISREEVDAAYLDIGDVELKQYIDKINKNATIFLNSCSNAKEGIRTWVGLEENNFANFIRTIAGNRKVYASKEPFNSSNIEFESYVPFRIRIMNHKKKSDITYSSKD